MVDTVFLRELADAIKEGVDANGDVTLGPTDAEACIQALRFQSSFIPLGFINADDQPRAKAVA